MATALVTLPVTDSLAAEFEPVEEVQRLAHRRSRDLILLNRYLVRPASNAGPLTLVKTAAFKGMVRTAMPRRVVSSPRRRWPLKPIRRQSVGRRNDRRLAGPTRPANSDDLHFQRTNDDKA